MPPSAAPLPSEPVPDPATETDFGWALSVLSGAFLKWAGTAVAGLPGAARGYLVLDAVARGEHRSQLALARRLGVDKTAMTYLLDELEAAKLVTRRPDPIDRRARRVELTAKGAHKLAKSREQIDATEARLLAPLNATEARAFHDLLARVAVAAYGQAPDVGAMRQRSGPSVD